MSEHNGSCLCGQVKWTITGEPKALAVCHCIPCRITTGTSASHNFIVPEDQFKLEGQTKTYTRKGDSGKNVTYNFCTECPTILVVEPEAMPGIKIVKAGTCTDNDWLTNQTPAQEIYVKNRYPWVKPTGAEEHQTT